MFPVVILVVAAIYVYINNSFATNGNRLKLERGGDIYEIYCSVFGRKFGKQQRFSSIIFPLWFAAFLAEIGAKNKLGEVNIGMGLSALFIFGAAAVCCLTLIGHIDATASADIPALVLAAEISPILTQLFAIVICAGIYTSAVPLLWTGVRKVAQEGTLGYKIVTVAGGIIGCIIACFIPYKGLINVLYGINGYLGFILVFFMIVYDAKTGMSSKMKK